MTAQPVTALILLTERHPLDSVEGILDALAAQSRAPDSIVLAHPAGLPAPLESAVHAAFEAGRLDEVLRIPLGNARARGGELLAAAARETLALQGRTLASADAAEDPSGSAAARAAEPGEEALATPGRRAREIDQEAERREFVREASSLAQVPVRLRTGLSAGGSRRSGRRRAAVERDGWLWLLTAEAMPGHESLQTLLESVEDAPTTTVIGSKRLAADLEEDQLPGDHAAAPWMEPATNADGADELLDVGLSLSHAGRLITGIDPGEIDQGQADWRQDTLAVALPGMLVRESTLSRVGGFDAALPTPWAEIDLCQRVWRSGDRVAVVGPSRVLASAPALPRHELLREHRRGQLLALIKQRPFVLALLTLLITAPLAAIGRAIGAVAAHRPRLALAELRGYLGAWPAVPAVLARAAGDSRRSPVPRRRLAPLYLPRGEDVRQRADSLWTRLFADDERSRRIRRTTWGIAGTSHGSDDADFGRHGMWTLVLVLVSAVLGMLAIRPLLGRGRLVGPQLTAMVTDWSEARQSAWADWIPAGLGQRGPADPLVRLLGSVPLPDAAAELLLIAALPLAALGAWWAAGAITRAVGARLAVAVAWAAAPPLLAALVSGAWPLVLVHLLLPLLALAIGRAIGLVHKVSQASVAAAAAGGLLLLVIGAVQPVLVLVVAAALAVLALPVPGRRLRLLWVLVPSLALHLPYLPQYLGSPSLLLHVGGIERPGPAGSLLETLALWPSAVPRWGGLTGLLGAGSATWVPLLLLLPVLVAALAAPFLAGDAGRAGRFGLLVGALVLALVLIARAVPTAVTGDGLVPEPLHALLSTLLLILLVAAAATYDATARLSLQSRRRRIPSRIVGAGVAVFSAVAAIGWVLVLPGALAVHRTEAIAIPQAAQDESLSQSRSRVLVLTQETAPAGESLEAAGEDAPAAGTRVHAELVVSGGRTIPQIAGIAEARDLQAVRAGESIDADPASAALRAASGQLLSAGAPAEPAALRTLAIRYVVVPGAAEDSQALVDALDSSPQLEKVTQNTTGGLWRVVEPGSRALVRPVGEIPDPALEEQVPSLLIDAGGQVAPSAEDRLIVLSERRESGWRASAEGAELLPVTVDGWAQGWALPAGAGGEIRIERSAWWVLPAQLLLIAVLAVTALIAVPWRGRSVRRRREETWFGGVL